MIYLGIKPWGDKSPFSLDTSTSSVGFRKIFWQGGLSNVLNPKIAIFFLAFLPQFVDTGSRQVTIQMILLGITFTGFGITIF